MDSMQQHTIQIFMWVSYPESAKIHQKVSGGFWRIQDMSNIYAGGFWWIQDTSILCVTKLVDFGGFRILSSKNTLKGWGLKTIIAGSLLMLFDWKCTLYICICIHIVAFVDYI